MIVTVKEPVAAPAVVLTDIVGEPEPGTVVGLKLALALANYTR